MSSQLKVFCSAAEQESLAESYPVIERYEGFVLIDVPDNAVAAIARQFPVVVALDNVDLELKKGEIRGLLGGNGAGKTTLMNILYGLYKSDSGQILVDGQPYNIHAPEDAIKGGIGMVHQQFLQINGFTVAENIVLGTALKNRPTLQLAAEKAKIRELSQHFGLPVDPDATVADLPMGVRQRVEILKAHSQGLQVWVSISAFSPI